ncbi:hypothetical protein [Alicyclobacillus sp. SO9]|uniref:hypothetical protein n=1 Tax=Alicyclobacillus sp. SO9 TaxID=2665646 RepID=UPI0018E7AE43|nr:hypothetical protein [Alicyclobacillus sp. SO9]QQE78993.1 hypothetical protein GI364_00225 [Alicyclobacillus sp. SO9]
MKTAKFLFWLGIAVIVVELFGNTFVYIRMLAATSQITNTGAMISSIAGSFVGGGILIGLSKIIERLYSGILDK